MEELHCSIVDKFVGPQVVGIFTILFFFVKKIKPDDDVGM